MMGIRDIDGAYCPMGCGMTLHLTAGCWIRCLAPDCPDKDAAQKVLSDPEHLDVVTFTQYGHTVLHPLRERLDGVLFDCPVHRACSELQGPPDGYGRYRASVTQDGILKLELVPEEPA